MGTASEVVLRAARWEACIFTIVVMGLDLDGADFNARLMLDKGLQRAPLVSVNRTAAVRAPGVRLVSVDDATDAWGRESRLEVVFSQPQMEGLPRAASRDDSLSLAWALDIRMPGYLTPTRIYGDFVLTPDGGTSIGAVGPFAFGDQIIHVRVEAGQGPRGRASGPLGAGSVGSEEISDDADEQDAIREKIGANITRFFDVKRHGAFGNWEGDLLTANDDYAAFVSAIAAASEKGGVVWVFGRHLIKDFNLVIMASNVTFAGPGSIYFVTDDAAVWGYLFWDGRSGRLENVGWSQVKLFGPAELRTTGLFDDDGNYVTDFTQPGYDSSSTLAQFLSCDHVWIGNAAQVADAPTYGAGGRDCHHVTIDGLYGTRCPAVVQFQSGTGPLVYNNITGEFTSDDFVAAGYWGEGENDLIAISNIAGRNIGGRGVILLGWTGHATVSNAHIVDSFMSPFQVESNAKLPENRRVGSVTFQGCRSRNGGMWLPTAYNRSADQAAGIMLNPRGGRIGEVKVIGHTGQDSRNSHIAAAGPGSVASLEVLGGSFVGIGGIVPQGAPIYSTVDGSIAVSIPPESGNYSGFALMNVDHVRISGPKIDGAWDDGIYISPLAERAIVDKVDVANIDLGASGGRFGVRNQAVRGLPGQVTLSNSPASAGAQSILSPVTLDAAGSLVVPRATVIATATFSGGNTTFGPTGLGTTTTGGKTFVGDDAKVDGGKAVFRATQIDASQVIDCGTPDVMMIGRVYVPNGGNSKLVGRVQASGIARTASHVLFDLQGSEDASVPSNLQFFDYAAGYYQPGGVQLAGVVGDRWYWAGLMIDGDYAWAYLGRDEEGPDGLIKIGGFRSAYAFPVTNFFGFLAGNQLPGLSAFDNFTWFARPA